MSGRAQPRRPRKVVILDKDIFFREFQRSLLSGQGYEVVAPTEPHQFTAEYIKGIEPSLIITEILLPGMNGLDLVRELRETPGLDSCFIVVFSVLQAEARALSAGADEFVQKPMMRQEYLTTITERLGRESEEPTP